MSGANSTPLGRMNPAIGAGKRSVGGSLLNPSYFNTLNSPSPNSKREHEINLANEQAERKKRRKSRWQSDEKDKTFIPGMPTVLPSNMNTDQEKAYLLQLQIEELSRRLRSNDLGIPPNPEDRSPSPEPIYNNEGKRLNTREYRTRKKVEDDRHSCITRMLSINPEYKPPADYKPPLVKVSDKVMIPQEEHPDINFVGLLIGPRGNTLKSMEKDTGAKIIIRGKGSVKEGKVGRKDGGPMPGEDEPLHAYVTASNPESVKKAVDRIKEIIRQGVEVPEGQNDLRRMQLRELALLNGTLRENDNPRCSNCGSTAHKSWQCPDKPNITSTIICSHCGGAGHIMRDCKFRNRPLPEGSGQDVDRQKIDEEYMSLMAELGEGPAPSNDGKRQGNSGPPRNVFENNSQPKAIEAPRNPEWNNSFNGARQNRFQGNQFGRGGSSGPNGPPGPPGNQGWMQGQGYQGVPPPNLLSGLPPPPPPGSGGNNQNPPSWISQAPPGPPPPGISQWQGPPGPQGPPSNSMGCPPPPPGPVPPPRPVGPPPNWGWNGPNMGTGGSNGANGVDLGALLSAPPPPPPS